MYLLENLWIIRTLVPKKTPKESYFAFLINQKYSPDPLKEKKNQTKPQLPKSSERSSCSLYFFPRGTLNERLMNAFSWSASATNTVRVQGKSAPGTHSLFQSREQQGHFAVTSWPISQGSHYMGWREPVCSQVCSQHRSGCSWREYLGTGARKYSWVLPDRHGQNAQCL